MLTVLGHPSYLLGEETDQLLGLLLAVSGHQLGEEMNCLCGRFAVCPSKGNAELCSPPLGHAVCDFGLAPTFLRAMFGFFHPLEGRPMLVSVELSQAAFVLEPSFVLGVGNKTATITRP